MAMAMAMATFEGIRLYNLFHNLHQFEILINAIFIWFDNHSKLLLIDITKFYSHKKYIAIFYHFIW